MNVADRAWKLRDEAASAVEALTNAERYLDVTLPVACGPERCTWPAGASKGRESLRNELLGDESGLEKRLKILRADWDFIQRAVTRLEMQGQTGELQNDLTKPRTAVAEAEAACSIAAALLARWDSLVARYPSPIVSATAVVKPNRRYVATVTRSPRVDDPEQAKEYTETLATATFESHELARFGVALGFGALFRPESREYGVSDVVEDGTRVRRIEKTSSSSFAGRPLGLLEVYLGSRVDELDGRRSAKLALVFGTELKGTPDTFLLGLGVDWRGGLVGSIGITHYTGTELSGGAHEGQIVPNGSDGKPILDAAPTTSRSRVGLYACLGFRPSIFKALWGNLK